MSIASHRIDKSSPIPIYFQIAEAIRWQISTGHIKPGDPLAPTREAAKTWQVNRHTIRRAYQELVEMQLVKAQGTSRMIVAPSLSIQTEQRGLNSFADRVCRQARDKFDLSPIDLARLLFRRSQSERQTATMVECNHYQCFDLKRQLEQRFDISVTEHLLDREGEPPPGPIIGTVFHFNEICARWPERRDDMSFGGLYVNATLAERIIRCYQETKRRRNIVVYSRRHETDAFNLAADLEIALGNEDANILPFSKDQTAAALLKQGNIIAVAPWNWDELDEAVRSHPRCFLLQYCFDPIDIESIGESFGWFERVHKSTKIS